MATRRKFWGWGNEGEGPSDEQAVGIGKTLAQRFGVSDLEVAPAPRLEDIALPEPRVAPPDALAEICSSEPFERASHTYGKSYRDTVRGARGDFAAAPDVVAFPRDEGEVASVLDWCGAADLAAIPYGGGSSVVGGVEAAGCEAYGGAVSIDLGKLDRVLELDRTSRAGHFDIDDFVEALRVVTPAGVVESRRLPGSGAGPSPDRMFVGSEGTLGIITSAWMRLQDRPSFRASASVQFPGDDGFLRGAQVVRALSQSGLFPTNCRLLSSGEALTAGAGDGNAAILVLGFESADHALDGWMARALEIVREGGGEFDDGAGATRTDSGATKEGAAGAWRNAFLNAPYLRDVLVRAAVISETFETAITWDRFEEFHRAVTAATEDAVKRVCGSGSVSCRFTHVYPDGPAPYYTVLAPGRRGSELEQWAEIKAAAAEALIANGGTITHHHSVGRDHRPWYDAQRPELFASALRAAKKALDPAGVLNPGVLLDPR